MNWQFNILTLPIILSALIAFSLTIYAWRLRAAGTWVMPFILLALALAIWSVGYALELAVLELDAKILWIKIQYLGIVATPVAWLLFALQYSGRKVWESRNYLVALSIVPAITLLLVFTNEAHHLIWKQFSLVENGRQVVVDVEYGFWFWIHSAYSYLLILSGTVVLLRRLRRFPAIHFWQIVVLLLAPIVPLIGNGLYLFELGPIPQLDLGLGALDLLGSKIPALALIDLNLPYLSGEEILRQIRADKRLAGMKVAIVSADSTWASYLEDEANIVLTKPVGFRQLRDLAKRLHG